MEEAVKKNDPKWHKLNATCLEDCKAEWNNRQPWRDRWAKVKEIGKKHGLDEEGCQVVLVGLGYPKADNLTDVAVLDFEASLKEPAKDEPPF
jgi:ABC-type taurine transport system substrate-binding protein